MVIVYIIFGFFISGFCSEKNQKVSSICEADLPLSYKYETDITDLTESPLSDLRIDYFRHDSKTLKKLQYAPLNNNEETFSTHTVVNNLISSHKRHHLEPRVFETSQKYDRTSEANIFHYVEGHNIMVPQKTNNLEPNANAYRHDSLFDKNKDDNQPTFQSLSKLIRENFEYKKVTDPIKTYTQAKELNSVKNLQPVPINSYPMRNFQVLSALEKTQMEPVFNSFVKVPRLHLNIARGYNFAKLPVKAPLLDYKNKVKRPKQAYVSNIDVLLEEKTFLYPITRNKYVSKNKY